MVCVVGVVGGYTPPKRLLPIADIYCKKSINKKSDMTKAKITRRLKKNWGIDHSGRGNMWLNGFQLAETMKKYLNNDVPF